MKRPILVSACLLGLDTRYNGELKKNQRVLDYLHNGGYLPIPVCPEQLAGLPTPRPASCFQQGDGNAVLDGTGTLSNGNGEILNQAFIKGAHEVMKIARLCQCREALFKERSPSCGVHQIYRQQEIVTGSGVTTALLVRNGIRVFCEEDFG